MLLKYLLALAIAASPLTLIKPVQALTLISTSNGQVGSIDAQTGTFTGLTSGQAYTDIALDSQGELWGSTFNELYKIGLDNGQQSRVGPFGASINGLGFSDQDELYATGGANFYKVDLTNGNAALVGRNSRFQSSGDLVFDPIQQRFFATSRNGIGTNSLFLFNLAGESVEIGDIGFNNVYGLFFEEGVLYGHTGNRQQLTIDINTGQGQFDQNLDGVSGAVWGTASLPTTGSTPDVPEPKSVPEPFMVLSWFGLAGLALTGGLRRRHQN
ncbi:MAG: hypothetical protein AAGG51_26245 [Cyanobacteria bacterium P01_G01_bin.54]